MNIVNAHARVSCLSEYKAKLQSKQREELDKINQVAAKLNNYLAKVQEYDPYKANLILDNFNKWKENKIATISAQHNYQIFALEKRMQHLQTHIIYTQDRNCLAEAYKTELTRLNEQQNIERKRVLQNKRLRNLTEDEQRYYFLSQQYENIIREFAKQKNELKEKYRVLFNRADDKKQRPILKTKYRDELNNAYAQYYKRVDILERELKEAKLIVKTNLPSQKKLVVQQTYLTNISRIKSEYLRATNLFNRENNRAKNVYRKTIKTLQSQYKYDEYQQRINAINRAYLKLIQRQKSQNLFVYHKQLEKINVITRAYLNDKRKLDKEFATYKHNLRTQNLQRINKLHKHKKRYLLSVASIKKLYIKQKKSAIASKSNASVLKHLKTLYVNKIETAKRHFDNQIKSVKPIPTQDFKPAYRNLYKTYQLDIRNVRKQIIHDKKIANEKNDRLIQAQKLAIHKINREKQDKFDRTPASYIHHDNSVAKIKHKYLHDLTTARHQFVTSNATSKKILRQAIRNESFLRKELKTHLKTLKNKYFKQIDALNSEIRQSKLPTAHDLQRIEDLKTSYAKEVQAIHNHYFEQRALSKKNVQLIRNKTNQELKRAINDKRHASHLSFTFESKFIAAARIRKTRQATKLYRQNLNKIKNNDIAYRQALRRLTQKHIDFKSSQHITHVKTLNTHYDSRRILGKYIRVINTIRKSSALKLTQLNTNKKIVIENFYKRINKIRKDIVTRRKMLAYAIRQIIIKRNNNVSNSLKIKKSLQLQYANELRIKLAAFNVNKNAAIKDNNYQEARRLKSEWKMMRKHLTHSHVQAIATINAKIAHVKHDANIQISQCRKNFNEWLSRQNLNIKACKNEIKNTKKITAVHARRIKAKRISAIRGEIKKYRVDRAEIAKVKRDFIKKANEMKKQHHEKMLSENRQYVLSRRMLINTSVKNHNAGTLAARRRYQDTIKTINKDCADKLVALHKTKQERINLYVMRIKLLRANSTKAIIDIKNSLSNLHKDTVTRLNQLEHDYHHSLVALQTQLEKDRKMRIISAQAQLEKYHALKTEYHQAIKTSHDKFNRRHKMNVLVIPQEKQKIVTYAKLYHDKIKMLRTNYLSQLNDIRIAHYSATIAPRVQYLQKIKTAREQLKLALQASSEKYLVACDKYKLQLISSKENLNTTIYNIRNEQPKLEHRVILTYRQSLVKLHSKYQILIDNLKKNYYRQKKLILQSKGKDRRAKLNYALNQYAIKYDQLFTKYHDEKAAIKSKHKFWLNPHKLVNVDFSHRKQALAKKYMNLVDKAKLKYLANMKIANESRNFLTPSQLLKIRTTQLAKIYNDTVTEASVQLANTIHQYKAKSKAEYKAFKQHRRVLLKQKKYDEAKVLTFEFKNNYYIQYRVAMLARKHAKEVYRERIAKAKLALLSALKGAKQSDITRLRNEHAMPMFERLYANVTRIQKRLAQAELSRITIMKEDKKLRKVYTNLPLWVSTYIKFAFIVSSLWIFLFVVLQLLYFLVGGDVFVMFRLTDGSAHLSPFGMIAVVALVMSVCLTFSSLILYILECKSKRHVESKLRLENIQTLEKTNQQLNREYKKLYQLTTESYIQNNDLAEKIYIDTKNVFQNRLDNEVSSLKHKNYHFIKHLNHEFVKHNKFIVNNKNEQIAQQDVTYARSLSKHLHDFNANIQAQANEANNILISKQTEFRHKIRQLISLQQQEISFKQAEIQSLEVFHQRETNKYKQAISDLVKLQNQELQLKQIEYSKNLATNRRKIDDVLKTNRNIYNRNRNLVNEVSRLRKEVVKATARANSLAARVRTEQKIEKLKGDNRKQAKRVAKQQKLAYKQMLKQKRINARIAKKQARKMQKRRD